MCEALYLFGVMLLLLDELIEGPVRERIILCYYRNKGGENISRINEVRQLCRDTKFRVPSRRTPEYVKPDNYPEDYFARFKFDSNDWFMCRGVDRVGDKRDKGR